MSIYSDITSLECKIEHLQRFIRNVKGLESKNITFKAKGIAFTSDNQYLWPVDQSEDFRKELCLEAAELKLQDLKKRKQILIENVEAPHCSWIPRIIGFCIVFFGVWLVVSLIVLK